ncbi:MAG: PDZ domain-containing protein [Candidatus Nanopelagicales bacterium]
MTADRPEPAEADPTPEPSVPTAEEPGTVEPRSVEPGTSRRRRQRSRRTTALVVSAMSLVVLLAVAALLPVPYVRLSPGPTFNVIGEYDGTPLIEISGTPTYPTSGNLDMTTVSESGGPRGGLTLGQALLSWTNSEDAVLPRELLYPDDVTGDEVEQENAVAFSTSQSDATAAALNHLGIPLEQDVLIASVAKGSPAEGKLEPRDQILQVDGREIAAPEDVGEAVRARPVGSDIAVTVRRDGEEKEVVVTSAPNPDDPERPYLGITVAALYQAPFTLTFSLDDVGGPSAGLMFSLGIIDKLTPEDLADGRHVAGTGTITPDGKVGPIGGIRQKLAGARGAGAELFLMPVDHCAEAAGHVPDGLTVVPVATLAEAVDALDAWHAGGTLPTCPAS